MVGNLRGVKRNRLFADVGVGVGVGAVFKVA